MFTQELAPVWNNLVEEIRYDITGSNRIDTNAGEIFSTASVLVSCAMAPLEAA